MMSLSRGLQRIERLLWATAVLALVVYAGARAVSALHQSYASWSFARALGREAVPAATPPPLQPRPDTSWMARLEIPRLNYSVIVREGTDRSTLALGVGHIAGTALPGPSGNVGLAGHRDTFFRRLGELKIGDSVRLQTLNEDYTYTVTQISIVKPSENKVLSDTASPSLTLVTCYPLWGIGAAPQRLIVQATRSGTGRPTLGTRTAESFP
jgi:sortase A